MGQGLPLLAPEPQALRLVTFWDRKVISVKNLPDQIFLEMSIVWLVALFIYRNILGSLGCKVVMSTI